MRLSHEQRQRLAKKDGEDAAASNEKITMEDFIRMHKSYYIDKATGDKYLRKKKPSKSKSKRKSNKKGCGCK